MALFNKMEPNTKDTLEKVSDAVLSEPAIITVDINPQNRVQAWLIKAGVLPKQRVFIIKPIYLGSLIRISKLLLSIDMTLPNIKNQVDNGKYLEMNYHAIERHTDKIAVIVATAIQNNRQAVSKKLVRFVLDNFTTAEMMHVLQLVLVQMDLKSFMTSIISVRGLNVLDSSRAAGAKPANGNEVSL